MRVLCVCLGNICRSPMAEVVLRKYAPDWQIDSAGTGAWHVGKPPYGPMQNAAKQRGYDLSQLRARQISSRAFLDFDVILVMDDQNHTDVEALRPTGSDTAVRLFAETPVPDPYYTGDFDGTLNMIESAAAKLVTDSSLRPRP